MRKFLTALVMVMVVLGGAAGALVYITPPPPKPPEARPLPETGAVSFSILDGHTGRIYGEKMGNLKIYPASTTKILTCIIALEEGKALLDQNVRVSPRAMAQDGTNLGMRMDLPLSLRETLYGMMLVSGNDAAVAVGETVGGSYERFVAMMNEKASSIGVSHSHFANPNGLTDSSHYTTADDMVKIAAYAMKNPEFQAIVKAKTHKLTYRDGMYRNIENRNEFLESGYAGANGIKTGMTEAAGDCLVASAERNGRLMITAVYNDKNRWNDVKRLLDYGFQAAADEEAYQAALAAEPALYKWVNRLMGREADE